MYDVACEFAFAAVRSKDAQKQLARTSLNTRGVQSEVVLNIPARNAGPQTAGNKGKIYTTPPPVVFSCLRITRINTCFITV